MLIFVAGRFYHHRINMISTVRGYTAIELRLAPERGEGPT